MLGYFILHPPAPYQQHCALGYLENGTLGRNLIARRVYQKDFPGSIYVFDGILWLQGLQYEDLYASARTLSR